MANSMWWRAVTTLGSRSNVERVFAVRHGWRLLFSPLERLMSFSPSIEVVEHDDAHVLVVDLPGIPKEDVDVRIDDHHILTISGERRARRGKVPRERPYSERRYGTFSRSIELPRVADASRMDAVFHDGVLEIRLPKLEVSRGRSVQIGHRELGGRDGVRGDSARASHVSS